MSADVASGAHRATRVPRPADSNGQTREETRLRVLAGSGEKTLPSRGESSTSGDTQSARADSAPTPSCGTARIAIDGKLNTPHSPKLRPSSTAARDSINHVCITEIIDFYLPTPESNSHPEVRLPRRCLIPTPWLLFRVICYTTKFLFLTADAERGGDKS